MGRSVSRVWSADPLGWITTSNLPLGVAVASAGYTVLDLGTAAGGGGVLGQLPAVALMAVAFAGLHVVTRPPRTRLRERAAWLLVLAAVAALILSAVAYVDVPFRIELWWATVATALLLVGLAPYSTVPQLARYGAVILVATVAVALGLVYPDDPRWPPLTTVMLSASPIAVGIAASAVFSGALANRVSRWSERPIVRYPTPTSLTGPAVEEDSLIATVDASAQRRTAAARAFLREIVDRSEITADDRRRARELGEALRAELVAVADQTWLQRVADGHPIEVDDPDRLADDLSLPQRVALRALLDALLAHPDSGFVSARIELVAAEGRAVAVGVQLLSTLPEGRRVTFLAPYYVSLQSTVRSIRWRNGAHFEAEFDVSGNDDGRPSLVQRAPAPIPARPRD